MGRSRGARKKKGGGGGGEAAAPQPAPAPQPAAAPQRVAAPAQARNAAGETADDVIAALRAAVEAQRQQQGLPPEQPDEHGLTLAMRTHPMLKAVAMAGMQAEQAEEEQEKQQRSESC